MSFIDEPMLTKACKHIKKHRLNIVFITNKFDGLIIDFLTNKKKIGQRKETNKTNKTQSDISNKLIGIELTGTPLFEDISSRAEQQV